MICTIAINPALDINLDCDQIIRPTTIRTKQEKRHAGGKGTDVSRVVRNLGGTSVAMGFLGGFTGESIKGLLLEEGLERDSVAIAEETRTNVIISAPLDTAIDKKRDHRFNSQGPKFSLSNPRSCSGRLRAAQQLLRIDDQRMRLYSRA